MQTLQVFMNKHCRHVDIKPRLVRVGDDCGKTWVDTFTLTWVEEE